MQQGDDFGSGGGQMAADGGDQDIQSPFFADGQAAAEQGAWRLPQPLAVPHAAHQLRFGVPGHDPFELAEGGGPQDAVHREADIALEIGQDPTR